MAQAVFFSRHTFAYALGAVLVMPFWLLVPVETSAGHGSSRVAILAAIVVVLALFEAALFSWGCAFGAMARLTRTGWAAAAGAFASAGLIAFAVAMGSLPPATDLESHKTLGLLGMLRTLYVMGVPILLGVLCAWLAKRVR